MEIGIVPNFYADINGRFIGLKMEKGPGPFFIVTGNMDFLVLKRYRTTSIVTPRELWEKERKRKR